jgi:ABC-2 type transport system ATP-binding protein
MSAGPDVAAATIVRIEGLVRRFDGVTAVDGISFEVRRGEMFGLIGPDGAGKTTTLRAVLGLLRPDGGVVRVFDLDPVAGARELSRRTGYLSQRFSLYGDLTVDENVAFFAAVHGVPGWRARREELLDMLRMTPFRRRLADRLSGGMKQKLALACTLVHTPALLVLDEPTTGVDPVSRRDFWRILAGLQRNGMTILLTTPYLDEAERCHRVGLISHGQMLAVDTPAALRQGAAGVIVEILAQPHRRAAEILAARPEVSDVQVFGERLHATLAGVSGARAGEAAGALSAALIAAGVVVQAARPTEPSLEDIFIARLRASGDGVATTLGVRP